MRCCTALRHAQRLLQDALVDVVQRGQIQAVGVARRAAGTSRPPARAGASSAGTRSAPIQVWHSRGSCVHRRGDGLEAARVAVASTPCARANRRAASTKIIVPPSFRSIHSCAPSRCGSSAPRQFSRGGLRSAFCASCRMKRGICAARRRTNSRIGAASDNVAGQRPEIEVDVRLEQVFRRALVDPVIEAGDPFVGAQAALRLAGHDAALAQRVAAGVERVVDLARPWPARRCGRRRGRRWRRPGRCPGRWRWSVRSAPRSRRPASTPAPDPARAARAASCTTRSVSRSLRWLISSVSERAESPCAIRSRAWRRMSGAARPAA